MENSLIIKNCIETSKKNLQEQILQDNLIIFFVRIIEDIKEHNNPDLFGRVKDFYYIINPYQYRNKSAIYNFFKQDSYGSEGLILTSEEMSYLKIFFRELNEDFTLKNPSVMKGRINGMLTKLMEKYFAHSLEILESFLLARMIASAGGIKNLSRMPSSSIQLIGAEKALFKAKRFNGKTPKYGLLYYSKYVQQEVKKAKTARQLANKLFISTKLDYFNKFAR